MNKNNSVDKHRAFDIELWLTIVFYLLALASLLAFFVVREEYPRLFMYLGCGAVAIRIIFYVKRFIL